MICDNDNDNDNDDKKQTRRQANKLRHDVRQTARKERQQKIPKTDISLVRKAVLSNHVSISTFASF